MEFNSFNSCEIRKRDEKAYEALVNLVSSNDLSAFCNEIEGLADLEWHPSLVKVYFEAVCVDVYFNEIDGSVEEIRFFE